MQFIHSAFILSLISFLLVGCSTVDDRISRYRAYFEAMPVGTPVPEIEEALQLPDPVETEAPASDWPGWKMRYLHRGVMVYFVAESVADVNHHTRAWLQYQRDWEVLREEEYWRRRVVQE